MKFTALFISIALVSFSHHANIHQASAQQAQPAPGATCQSDPHFQDWDFWIGEWTVTAGPNDVVAGENSIKSIEDGCAISEHWTNAGGGTGSSLNYYNPNTGKWRQLWVSGGAGGYSIDYSGGLVDGSMVLVGEIHYYGGNTEQFRGTWTPNQDGSVRQFFEQYNSEDDVWVVWFDGNYRRK